MLTVVTWLWAPPRGYRSAFGPEHVNVLQRMVARHYPHPHRFVCVTDRTKGLAAAVEVIAPWNDFADLPSPHGGHNPSCYRRLRSFHPEIGTTLGARHVSLDLDTVIVGDLSPLWDGPEAFKIWKEQDPRSFYNGSMWRIDAGARPQVWTRFNPQTSPAEAKAAGRFGSDQGWISHVLGRGEATWSTADGVYSYNCDLRKHNGRLPADARIVMFHGGTDPWSPAAQKLDWVRRCYQ